MPRPPRRGPALLLVLALLALLAPARPVVAANSTKAGRSTLAITVPVDLVLGPDVDSHMKTRLESAFATYWGEANKFHTGCRKLILKLAITQVTELPPDDSPRHRVVVFHPPGGVKDRPDDVDFGTAEGKANYDPTTDAVQGNWDDVSKENVYAHEFGHLLGLPDEYDEHDLNGNGVRDGNDYTTPKSGADAYGDPYADSLMADGGKVRQRYLDVIAHKHFSLDELKCKVHARQETTQDWEVAGATPRHVAGDTVLEVDAVPDAHGKLTGTATLTGTALSTGSDPCGSHYDLRNVLSGVGLTVGGRLDGAKVELTIGGQMRSTPSGPQVNVACDGSNGPAPTELTVPLFQPVRLAGMLPGGRYRKTEMVDLGGGMTATVRTTIELRPPSADGEGVG